MSNSYRLLNAANPKNLKPIVSNSKEPFPNNKPYLESSPPAQSTVRQFNRQKMIEQNQKMKKQVLQLAKQMEQIVSKNHKKKKYGINLDQKLGSTQSQKIEVQKQQSRIVQLKNQIFNIKKENDFTHDNNAVIEKENAVKALQLEIKQLESQKSGLVKVKKQQEKALNFLKNNDGYNEKIQKSRSQLAKLKQQCKTLALKTAQNEKMLLKTHQKVVGKNKKIKQVQERIRENKQKIKKGNQHIVTIEMISQIEGQIMKLESEYKDIQKTWLEKINNVEVEYNNRRVEEQKKLIILKDKEREAKLNEIRLKQFRKLIIQGRSQKQEQNNMKEFRNKRNIKYMDNNHP